MTSRTAIRNSLALIATLLLSATAQAQLFRAYLAPDGSDANPCTLQQPCRLLPAALAAVASGGEIWMLDSANYNSGAVHITKSVTILAVPGALGSVVATGGNAIIINTVGVKVALRNLVIVPLPGGSGTNGIFMQSGTSLTVENCLIANLPGIGIYVGTTASLRVTDSTIRDNGEQGLALLNGTRATVARATISGNGLTGIFVSADVAGVTTTADIVNSTIDANADGITASSVSASGGVKVSVRDSMISRSATGVFAGSGLGASVTLSASNNVISNHSGVGMAVAGTGSRIWVSGNTVSDNATGLNQAPGGLFESAGNNAVRNNGTDKSGTITVVAME